MAFINIRTKEVQVKVVYYGPGRGGKTTNLEYIYKKYRKNIQSEMVSLKTHDDRTLFFDFLPFDVGKIKGYNVSIQLYTVPGQVKYNATRKLVLKGVDGIVFVADAMESQRQKNIDALKQMIENLETYSLNLATMPLVLQYNKYDLKDSGITLLSPQTMQKDLNRELRVPAFAASALRGGNVVATLKKIISLTLSSIQDQLF